MGGGRALLRMPTTVVRTRSASGIDPSQAILNRCHNPRGRDSAWSWGKIEASG